jgi:hypothetical protein
VIANGSYNYVTFFKYDLINTGILMSDERGKLSNYILDLGGIAVNYQGWGLAFTVSLPEIYDRPTAVTDYTYQGQLYYTIEVRQEGYIRNYNLGISRSLGERLSIGIGLNYEKGSWERGYWESWVGSDINLSSVQKHELKGYFLNGGVVFDLSEEFSLAAVFRTPYTRNADSESMYRNLTPAGSTDIIIDSKGESNFKRPLMLGGGVNYVVSEEFRLAADVSFFNWSKYEVEYIGVPSPRSFKNTLRINLGGEYQVKANVFKQQIDIPLWFGFGLDPQPVEEPGITYYSLSLGFGLRGGHLFMDAGGTYGWESGSGDDLNYIRLAVTLGYKL